MNHIIINIVTYMIFDFHTFECIEEMNKFFTKEYYKYPPFEEMILFRSKSSIDPIKEGLISTYPADTVVKHISKKFDIDCEGKQDEFYEPLNICYCDSKKSSRIYVNQKFYNENKTELDRILNAGGYYFALETEEYKERPFSIFEKKFDEDVFDELKNNGLKYLYHISPSINTKKIMLNGLIPKSKNMRFNYPDRIYLFGKEVEENQSFLYYMCEMLFSSSIDGYFTKNNRDIDITKQDIIKRGLNEFSVFRIDLNKIKNIKIFEDPNTENFEAFYVNTNIKPEWIEDTGRKFKFDI